MIIGVIGPVLQDTQLVADLVTEEKSIQIVDSLEVIRAMDRKYLNSITTQEYHKKYFLKQLESELGTLVVMGNIILNQKVCQWILQDGGIVIVVSRNKMEDYDGIVLENTEVYWADEDIQRYELEYKFKHLFEVLQQSIQRLDNLYLIDLTDEDSEDLNRLVKQSQEWEDSQVTGLSLGELLTMVIGKEDKHMTMEESIRQAMKELGVEMDDEPTETVEKPKTTKKKQKPEKPVAPKSKEVVEKKQENLQEEQENLESDSDIEQIESIFVKLTDTTMALLLPVDIQLEKQFIGGRDFNVATVAIPDWSNRKLQELELKGEKKQEETSKSKPVEKSKPKANTAQKPVKTTVVSDNLKELQEEKAKLDAEIKKYRAAGDMDMVNTLRKQRRAVRGKINSLK